MDIDEAEIIRFFVPEACVKRLKDIEGTESTLTTMHEFGLGFRLKGWVLKGRRDRLLPKLTALGLERTAIGYTPNMVTCAVYSIPGSLTTPSTLDLPLEFRRSSNAFLEDFFEPFQLLSTVTGLDITVHMPETRTMPLLPIRKNGIDVVIGACPPGDIQKEHLSVVCGVRIAPYGKGYGIETHTRGYGLVVKNEEDDFVLGQIVGTTIYIPLPTYIEDLLIFYTKAGGSLMFRCLEKMWKWYVKGDGFVAPATALTTPEECANALKEQDAEFTSALSQRVESLKKEVELALGKYNTALKDLYAGQVFIAGLQMAIEAESPEILQARNELWGQLLSDPRVASIEMIAGVYQVTTTPIIFVDGLIKRPLGSFGIRINDKNEVFVWSFDSPHPKRVPHPHISVCGHKCFGNVGPVVLDELTARNTPRAFLMILDWLEDGYDAQLADVKIEEWPILKEAS